MATGSPSVELKPRSCQSLNDERSHDTGSLPTARPIGEFDYPLTVNGNFKNGSWRLFLEPISKLFQEHGDAGELHKAEEV